MAQFMKDLKKLLNKKLKEDKKRVLLLALLAVIILAFIIFLTSLSSEDTSNVKEASVDNTEQSANTSGSLDLNQTAKVPASQKYDYTNLLNDTQNEQTAQTEIADPFANMRPQTTPDTQVNSTTNQAISSQDALSQGQNQNSSEESVPQETVTYPQEVEAWLYCDSFDSENQAQEHKALIAFQGASSTVVQNSEGKYQLKIGPFANREIGRSEFNKLGEAGLVERCALVDEAKTN